MTTAQKILIVENDVTTLRLLTRLMERENWQVLSTPCGEEAIDISRNEIPKVILLDLWLPGISGYGVCKKLRGIPELQKTRILMISNSGLPEERIEGYRAGADDYIVKPFYHEELVAKVRVFMKPF